MDHQSSIITQNFWGASIMLFEAPLDRANMDARQRYDKGVIVRGIKG